MQMVGEAPRDLRQHDLASPTETLTTAFRGAHRGPRV